MIETFPPTFFSDCFSFIVLKNETLLPRTEARESAILLGDQSLTTSAPSISANTCSLPLRYWSRCHGSSTDTVEKLEYSLIILYYHLIIDPQSNDLPHSLSKAQDPSFDMQPLVLKR